MRQFIYKWICSVDINEIERGGKKKFILLYKIFEFPSVQNIYVYKGIPKSLPLFVSFVNMEQNSPRKPRVSKPRSTASTRTGQSHNNTSSSSTATKPPRRRQTESADASSTRGNAPRPQKQQTAVSKIDGEDYDVIPSKSVDTLQSDKKTQERVAPSKVLKPKEHHKGKTRIRKKKQFGVLRDPFLIIHTLLDYHTFIKCE